MEKIGKVLERLIFPRYEKKKQINVIGELLNLKISIGGYYVRFIMFFFVWYASQYGSLLFQYLDKERRIINSEFDRFSG